MTIDDDQPIQDGPMRNGAGGSAPNGRHRSRTRIVVAVMGVAGLLGAGAYEITAQILDHNGTGGRGDVGALAPQVPPASMAQTAPESSPASGSVPSTPTVRAAAKQSAAAASPAPSRSLTVNQRIQAAREAAAKDGHPVQRPLRAEPGVAAAPVKERTEKTKTGVLRIITARSDLTGQRELLWAADQGARFGDTHCTQRLHFSNNARAEARPNVLLCWRTSANRSVATVLVDRDGKPSTATSVAVINREWVKLD